MDNLPMTHHAEMRVAQRSLSPQVLDWLLEFGSVARRNGCDVYLFDRRSRGKLRKAIGHALYRHIAPLLDCYVVVADTGQLVTAAHRLRRFQA